MALDCGPVWPTAGGRALHSARFPALQRTQHCTPQVSAARTHARLPGVCARAMADSRARRVVSSMATSPDLAPAAVATRPRSHHAGSVSDACPTPPQRAVDAPRAVLTGCAVYGCCSLRASAGSPRFSAAVQRTALNPSCRTTQDATTCVRSTSMDDGIPPPRLPPQCPSEPASLLSMFGRPAGCIDQLSLVERAAIVTLHWTTGRECCSAMRPTSIWGITGAST